MTNTCYTCHLLAQRDAGIAPLWECILRTSYWDAVHSYNTSLPGWIVLVARRHLVAIDELTEDEAAELGLLMRRISIGLKAITGCLKTYVIQFAEAAEHPHVHFHIVPRMPEQPEERCAMGVFGYLGVPQDQCVSPTVMNAIAQQLQPFLR